MNTYKLYVKTHQMTGLKYLGYTKQDPFVYLGSGKYWRLHLKKHGNQVYTEILFETHNKNEIKLIGIHYSTLWNIVSSNQWANLKLEEGDGGGPGRPKGFGDVRSPEGKARNALMSSLKNKGRKKPDGFGNKIREVMLGSKRKETSKEKMRSAWPAERRVAQAERRKLQNAERPLIACPHCGKQSVSVSNMNRYHFDNCGTSKKKSRTKITQKSKDWIFLSPDNIQVKVKTSLREFCKEHNLNIGSISDLSNGNRKSVNGWTFISKTQYDDIGT
jgi:hypothetical protein